MNKLNILQFICPTGFYGAERWVLALANNIDKNKVNCELAVTKEPGQKDLEILNHFDGESFQIAMKSRFDASAISELANIIKDRNIQIIHTHGYKSDILGLLAAKKTGIKCVSTPHGFENSTALKLRLYVYLGCLSLRFFNSVAPLSKELHQEIIRTGVPSNKITYIQNGVDLKEVDSTKNNESIPSHTEGSKKRIGFIGQIIPRKNVREILDVFDDLWQSEGDVELVLLGDGSERIELEKHAQQLQSKNDIHFLGFRTDRLQILKTFDIFVMTSSYEGIPRCLMETMAMEIPVVAYNIPGIDQLVQHGHSGLLASPGDKATLKEYWKKLLDEPSYARNIASQGRTFILEKFSAQRMAKEYVQLFSDLL